MLDAIKKLLGIDDLPREAEVIYLRAKDGAEAVKLLREEKGRMVRHRERIIDDLSVLEEREKELMDEGRKADSPIRREVLARQVVEVREKASAFLNRVDILTKKIAVFERHLDLLKDRKILTGPMPDPEMLEQAAGDVDAARRELEELIALSEATDGVGELTGERSGEDAVMREMEGERESEISFDELIEKHEKRMKPRRESEPPLEE